MSTEGWDAECELAFSQARIKGAGDYAEALRFLLDNGDWRRSSRDKRVHHLASVVRATHNATKMLHTAENPAHSVWRRCYKKADTFTNLSDSIREAEAAIVVLEEAAHSERRGENEASALLASANTARSLLERMDRAATLREWVALGGYGDIMDIMDDPHVSRFLRLASAHRDLSARLRLAEEGLGLRGQPVGL